MNKARLSGGFKRERRMFDMSMLSSDDIKNYLDRDKDPLVIMPLIEPEKQLRVNSVDLRLGSYFILFRKAELPTLDFSDPRLKDRIGGYYEKVYIPLGQPFILHPRELILGGTLEYLYIPKDLTAHIIGRSTWGRLGLIIATASLIQAGFKGCPTLELINQGNIPIPLYPGWPIAQLIFHKLTRSEKIGYKGKYTGWVGPTFPEFSKICDEPELRWLINKKDSQESISKDY